MGDETNTGGSASVTASSPSLHTSSFHDGEVVILLPGVEEPYRCPADQAQTTLLDRIPPRQDMIRVRAMREK